MDKWGKSSDSVKKKKTLWEEEKLLVTSNFFYSHNVFKSCLLLMGQNEYLWSKVLRRNLDLPISYSKSATDVRRM